MKSFWLVCTRDGRKPCWLLKYLLQTENSIQYGATDFELLEGQTVWYSRAFIQISFFALKPKNKGWELIRPLLQAFKNVLQPFRSPLKNIINVEQAAFSERAKSLGNASVWGLSDLCPDSKRNKEDFLVERRFKSPRDSYIPCFQIYELNEQFVDFMFCKLKD